MSTELKKVYKKFAFIVIPLVAGLIFKPLAMGAAVSGLISLASFYSFDRHPRVQAGETEPAAMFYSIREKLRWH